MAILNTRLFKNNKGMTLIELLAVIIILGIIIAIASIAIAGAFDRAKESTDHASEKVIRDTVARYYADGKDIATNVTTKAAWDTLAADLVSGGYLTEVPVPKGTKKKFFSVEKKTITDATSGVSTVTFVVKAAE